MPQQLLQVTGDAGRVDLPQKSVQPAFHLGILLQHKRLSAQLGHSSCQVMKCPRMGGGELVGFVEMLLWFCENSSNPFGQISARDRMEAPIARRDGGAAICHGGMERKRAGKVDVQGVSQKCERNAGVENGLLGSQMKIRQGACARSGKRKARIQNV